MNTQVQTLVLELLRTIKRLQPGQGNIARRNARRAVVSLLKRVRVRMDTEYPVEKRKPKERAKPETWARRQRKRGWVPLTSESDTVADAVTRRAAVVGIRLVSEPDAPRALWAPQWLVDHWERSPTTLGRMARDIPFRKTIQVEEALRGSDE